MGGKVPHNWKVEQWNMRGNIERVFAECDHLLVGIAAYEAVIQAYPSEHITLRHGAQVLRENKGAG
jgi:hypothetical protein